MDLRRSIANCGNVDVQYARNMHTLKGRCIAMALRRNAAPSMVRNTYV